MNPPRPVQLTQRQLELVRELSLLSAEFDLGAMFTGALHALGEQTNPESLAQAAHSLRELMEKLEGIKGIPVAGDMPASGSAGTLGQKVRELRDAWKRATARSMCLKQDAPSREVDPVLRKFLKKAGIFFDWFDKNPKFLSHKARGVVKGLDPLAAMLPQAVQDAQIAEWMALKNFFVRSAHHGTDATPDVVVATVASLERFLYIRLAPVRAQNQSAIERLIKEVEG